MIGVGIGYPIRYPNRSRYRVRANPPYPYPNLSTSIQDLPSIHQALPAETHGWKR